MPGVVGAGDPHLEQAMLAQLPPVSYLSRWPRRESAPPPSPALVGTAAAVPPAAQAEAGEASPGTVPAQAGDSGAAAADEAEPPKPVAPTLTPEQREAGRFKALEITARRKELRKQLQAGALTLAQALARDDEAARGMRTQTLLRALPGIGGATTARLLREAGIDPSRRAGALTAAQRGRLLAAFGTLRLQIPGRR